ncbi:MAG: hypothetical protein L0H63_15290, partial [Nitrococcus sp.]|nr:hypothetical protein [Nitrococcus sp.]
MTKRPSSRFAQHPGRWLKLMLISACLVVSAASPSQARAALAATAPASLLDKPGTVAENTEATAETRTTTDIAASDMAVPATLPRDLSLLGMYLQAD